MITTVEALKNLCVAIKNDGTKAENVTGETIPEVIEQITIAYSEKQTNVKEG